MVNVVMVLLSVLLPLLDLAVTKGPWTHRNVLRLLLVYAFVFDVGAVGFVFGFIPHVFYADEAAKLIGWPSGNPFQSRSGCTTAPGASSAFCASSSAAGSGWRPRSAGRSSCSAQPTAMCISCSSRAISLHTTSCRHLPTRSSRFGCSDCSTPTIAAAASRVCCAENAETSQRLRTGAVRKGREDHPEQVLVLLFRSSCGIDRILQRGRDC